MATAGLGYFKSHKKLFSRSGFHGYQVNFACYAFDCHGYPNFDVKGSNFIGRDCGQWVVTQGLGYEVIGAAGKSVGKHAGWVFGGPSYSEQRAHFA